MKRIISLSVVLVLLSVGLVAQVSNVSRIIYVVDARTIASNGTGAAAVLTLTPVGSYVAITCSDPDGCNVTMGEASIQDGMPMTVVNMSANTVNFADTAGVSELTGAAALDQYATLTLIYRTDRWVEVSRSSGSGVGTVTTTGSPANGNLAFFSGATSITNGNLSGEVTTSGTGAVTITNNAVTNARLRDSTALTVIGRSANSTGDPADIAASAASDAVLRESGSTLGFGTIATAGIANNAVTLPKIVNASAPTRILCRGSAAGAGNWEECTLGTAMAMSGTAISSTATGTTVVDQGAFHARLTTESGVPVSTTDRISQGTIYVTPYRGNQIALYVSAVWTSYNLTETSLALSALTSGKNYDVFIAAPAAVCCTITLSTAWSDDTTRVDALGTQDGVDVLGSDHAKRWVGTIRTTSTTTTEDSGGITGTTQVGGKRFVWNVYNQVPRPLSVIDTTDTWSYTTDTIRQAGGVAGNKVEWVTGDATSVVRADLLANGHTNSNSTTNAKAGIGIDSTTTFSGVVAARGTTSASSSITPLVSWYESTPGLGYHYASWNEKGGNGTSVFYGDAGADSSQSGLTARIWN